MSAPISARGTRDTQGNAEPRHTTADIVYDAFFAGALGGSAVALFFLLVDVARGQALLTPTVIGAALFSGTAPEAVTRPDLAVVAFYSGVHFAVFGLLGAVVSVLVHEAELHAKHPAILMFAIFAAFEVSFFGAATVLVPGVVAWLGYGQVAVANLLAAAAMGAFLVSSHRPDLWVEWRHRARLLAVGPGESD
jgi:hypothetical protein